MAHCETSNQLVDTTHHPAWIRGPKFPASQTIDFPLSYSHWDSFCVHWHWTGLGPLAPAIATFACFEPTVHTKMATKCTSQTPWHPLHDQWRLISKFLHLMDKNHVRDRGNQNCTWLGRMPIMVAAPKHPQRPLWTPCLRNGVCLQAHAVRVSGDNQGHWPTTTTSCPSECYQWSRPDRIQAYLSTGLYAPVTHQPQRLNAAVVRPHHALHDE